MSKPRSTKAEQFNAKIHGLREIFKRLDSKTLPLPTGNDVANYLQWFQDVLQGLVKEERPSLAEDKQRFDIQKYPAMAYVDLYKVLIKMARVVSHCELGSEAFAKNILGIMASLIPFLPKECIDSLPLNVAMFLSVWPETVHANIFNLLCGYIMPVVLHILKSPEEELSYATLACPSLVMTVLQYCPDSKQQAQFVETLMLYKRDVCLDLLAVVAYGPQPILNAAGQILLHYYPLGYAGGADDWQFMYESWYPEKCQNLNCMVPIRNNCVKICFDASYAASKCELAPPVFICAKCSELASKEVPDFDHFFLDLLDPLGPVPTKCQGETCKGQGVPSAMMCFSPECAKRNKNRGTAMCMECNDRYHAEGEGANHVVQSLFPDPWSMSGCEQAYVTEAVLRLLREAQPCQATRYDEMGLVRDKLPLEQGEEEVDNDINNRRMLSRFGIWLLVGICGDPTRCESPERMGRLVAMVIEWIDVTTSLMRDYVGELLKRLATQHASKWLTTVRDTKMELFCACLSPSPPEYAKVGGCWDSLSGQVNQLVEGLHRVCCLIPFQLVAEEVWDVMMPQWMDAIKNIVPQDELYKFKVLLCKLFDPYLSPYKMPSEASLGFVKRMLEESSVYSEQVKALTWLQMLSTLEVVIKLHMLTSMFIKAIQNQIEFADGISTMFSFLSQEDMSIGQRDSVHSAQSSSIDKESTADTESYTEPPQTADSTCSQKEDISNLSSFIIMLDLLVKQVQLQRQRENRILNSVDREEIKKLVKLMLDVSWSGIHGDHSASCQHCEMVAVWFKLAFMLFEAVFPPEGHVEDEANLNTVAFGNVVRRGSSCSKAASFRSTGSRRSAQITETIDEEEVFDETAESRSRRASGNIEPSGSVTEQQNDPDGSQGQGDQADSSESAASFSGMRGANASIGSWRSGTSSATWGAVYDNYPQLQLLIGLLKELPKQQDHVVQLNMLKCVKILVLKGEYLRIAMEAEPDFLAYLQEIFFVPNLWDMLRAEHSVLSEICVEILLHCICLPFGAEKLCDSVEGAFTDDDWRVRFAGVEKFTVIARFLEIEKFKSNKVAMSALAHCFTYLVGAVEDVCTPVSTRTIAMLETIKSTSLKTLYACIEHQYDAVPKDRLLLIHTCRILHRTLPHYTPLCGQFFIRRFKHLLIENADYVYGSPKPRSPAGGGGSAYVSPMSEVSTPVEADGSRKERWRTYSSTGKSSGSRSSRMQDTIAVNRFTKEQTPLYRCSYTFKLAGERISYNRQLSNSSEGNTPTGGRQRRTGGFQGQLGHSTEMTDRIFLGGRIQIDNLSTVEEEADSERADNDSTRMSHVSLESAHSQEPNQGAPQDASDLEAAATHQLVTLVMDFLAYPGANKLIIPSEFVKTESYEVVQMSHYLGVLMGYDIKVGEFTGDPRRLRYFPVFHAYMSGIVQVLDQNQEWGEELINLTLQLLLFCAAPKSQRRIDQPEFTLIRLSQPMRRTWLMTILIILYKYPFYHDSHRRDTRNLITVVINTLEAQDHKCPGPRSAKHQRQSLSLLDLENMTPEDATRPDTPGSPRHNKRAEACRASPTYKQRLSTCSSAIEGDKDADKNLEVDDQKTLPLMAIHETSFVGSDSSQQKATTSTPLLEFSPGGSRGGSSSALTDEERNPERRPLIDGSSDKKAKRVSVDSTSSRDTKESIEGVLSIGAEEGRKTSRPKLLAGVSMRSMDHSLERSLDTFMDTPGEKEPELQDIDLDVCPECGATLEEFDEETLNMAIVALSTYVHQSPSMAMPFLLRMLECVGRKCVHPMFPWEDKSDVLIPGSSTEVAKQFLRCVLIKLAPNGIFSELFRTVFDDEILLKAIAYALNDYSAFDQMSPIAYLLEDILGFRTLSDRIMLLLTNLSTYFRHASKETTSAWSSQLSHFENFFRKLPSALPENCDITPAFRIMSAILTAANSSFKVLLHPFGQVLTFGINKASFQLQDLLDLCSKCNETFPKERDKLYLTRIVVQEMMQAVRFRSYLPDSNLHSLLQVLAIDAGSRITFGGDRDNVEYSLPFGARTRAMDCIQSYLIEIVEFIRDWHFTSRSSNENKRLSEPNLNFDTVPIHLKAGMSQLAALELAKQPKSSKLYTKSLTWLKNPPSAIQLGPKELQDCVSNMRLLTWILQGSLSHVVNSKMAHASCQPIALEENVNIAKYVLIVLHSFAEPLKDSLKITALYHAFHLCELWTLYCDITKLQGEYNEQSSPIVLEFWGIVTPGILNLLTKAKEMSDLVGDNFLNLLEALQECNCTSLPKLYPLWHSILTFCFSLKGLSEGSSNKLRKAQTRKRSNKETRTVLARWLKQLQFKIALAEQSAANGQTHFHTI